MAAFTKASDVIEPQHTARKLGFAWIALCFALALHVVDEALTGFLSVYNPTVLALRSRYAWFPMLRELGRSAE